jgi:sulfite reductase (NADPH) flavoprotein alpha-component
MSRGIVSVNQYTGGVLGVRVRGRNFFGLVRALHVRLATGDVGRNILRWSAVGMLLSLVSGLYLWWPVKRVRVRGPWLNRRFWFDLHNSLGIFSLLPWLVLAVTGVVIGFEDQAAYLVDKLTGSSAVHTSQVVSRSEGEPGSGKPGSGEPGSGEPGSNEITADQAVAIACARLPGTVAYRVQMPQYGGTFVVALTYADNRIAGERNSIAVDPRSGKIISADLSTDLTATERFMAVDEAVHTGSLLGMPSKIVVSLAGILLPVQAVSGLVMWLRRRKIVRMD